MWYAVNLLYEGIHAGQPAAENLWEERLVLIEADAENKARELAERLARADEHGYVAANGDQVRWVFRQVERVHAIEDEVLATGTELFSRFLRSSEVASLLTSFQNGQASQSVKSISR